MAASDSRKVLVSLDADLVPWVEFSKTLHRSGITGYVNAAIRRDMEAADEDRRTAYALHLKLTGQD